MEDQDGGILQAFHGRITREEAESRLLAAAARQNESCDEKIGEDDPRVGIYLVRENPRNTYSLILSFTSIKNNKRLPQGGSLGVEHWQVNVNRYSKVEGFYFINRPNRVHLALDDLLHQQATHQARTPLPPPSEERVESAWWAELMLWRPTDEENPQSTLYALSNDLIIHIFSSIDSTRDLASLHLVCRHFYALARDDYIWRSLYRLRFARHVPEVQLKTPGDMDWKLKYYLDYTLSTCPWEPRVIGLTVPKESVAYAPDPGSRFFSIEYSTKEPNEFYFITDPNNILKYSVYAKTGLVPIYRVKNGYKVGYCVGQRDPASMAHILPSLQKVITDIRFGVCVTQDLRPAALLTGNDSNTDECDT